VQPFVGIEQRKGHDQRHDQEHRGEPRECESKPGRGC
jgi:hypothetical protein